MSSYIWKTIFFRKWWIRRIFLQKYDLNFVQKNKSMGQIKNNLNFLDWNVFFLLNAFFYFHQDWFWEKNLIILFSAKQQEHWKTKCTREMKQTIQDFVLGWGSQIYKVPSPSIKFFFSLNVVTCCFCKKVIVRNKLSFREKNFCWSFLDEKVLSLPLSPSLSLFLFLLEQFVFEKQ